MFVYKCDICKKEIADDQGVRVSEKGNLATFMFCAKCAKPVLGFLKKNKLLEEK